MTLIELLEVINENTLVFIYDINNICISYYDGKNNIDESLNNYNVLDIRCNGNAIEIIIKYEFQYS